MRAVIRLLALVLAVAASTAPARAQVGDSLVPSPADVLGYPLGKHFTPYRGIQEYARALAAASPLVEYRPYGDTPERRELFRLVIARSDYWPRMDAILSANAELAQPGTTAERAAEIAATNPAVVYFSYGVHGNEASSSEAAMWTAWDLARGAPAVAGVLDSLVVVIDPVVNPDGRARYVAWYRSVVGAAPDPDPASREHHEPWPGGRYNHYLFDLNRDWAWMTQPETRARLATWWRWNPEVHVDFHEMGYNSSYFFFPAAAPINPIYPAHVLEWGETFGGGNARAFNAHGWSYFTGDNYDLFYPGYGDSWPSLLGAIGMTYEQAGGGAAGLAVEQTSGDTLTLLDRATHHRVAGEATLRTAAAARRRLLLDYAADQRTVGDGEPDVLLVPGRDTMRARLLVQHLQGQGIEVERAAAAFSASASAYDGFDRRREFPAGTYRVRARQARGRLATTLLQPRTRLNAEFSYDISAWSLPYAYDVEAHQVRSATDANWVPLPDLSGSSAPAPAPSADYGYLMPPDVGAAAGIVRLLRAGVSVRVLARSATIGGRSWPPGTWFIPAAGNDSLATRATAAGIGARVTPVASGLASAGIDLGSASVWPVHLPRVAVLTGDGVVPTSYGAYWYFLEQRLGLGFDALLLSDVPDTDLADYDVIILPDLARDFLSDTVRSRLAAWVRRGGRLIAVAEGARVAADLFHIAARAPLTPDTSDVSGLLATRTEREKQLWQDEVPGAILPTTIDPANPLAWGAGNGDDPSTLFVLHQGDLAFEPADDLETIAFFPTELSPLSGVISEDNLRRLELAAWLADKRVGRGTVVLFADDPLFRLFWLAEHPLLENALLIGARR